MRNAIVTAADAKYLPAACCALVSCIRDGEAESHARFFLLACDVSTEDVQKADQFLGSQGASVEIITIEADRFRQFRIDGYVSASTYSRLLLPEFFDDQWNRVLYVDADMRVMARLETLLEADLHGKPIGAVHDYLQYLIYGIGGSRARLGLQPDAPYFNAGLICFDWPTTIASGLLQQAKAFAIENSQLCSSHDQDALNKVSEGAWAPLDPRWNFMTVAVPDEVLCLDYPARLRPYIAHFAGPVKPWTAGFPARYEPHRAWYRGLLRDSPWRHFAALANVPPAGTLQTSIESPLSAKGAAAQEPQHTSERGFPPEEASGAGEANPKLELLLDLMVAEAADFDRQNHSWRGSQLQRLLNRGSPLSSNPGFMVEFIHRVTRAFLLKLMRRFRELALGAGLMD